MLPRGGGTGGGIAVTVRRDPRMEARAAARAALMLAPPGAEHDVDGDGGSGFVGEVDDEEFDGYSQGCAKELGGGGAGGTGNCLRPKREPEEDEEAVEGPAELGGCGEAGADAYTGADRDSRKSSSGAPAGKERACGCRDPGIVDVEELGECEDT